MAHFSISDNKTKKFTDDYKGPADTIDVDEKGDPDKKKQRINLTPELITEILDNISDEDCRIMGIDPERSRPSDMIHKVFHVPPVHVRPSLRGDFRGGSTMENELTHKLADIIKTHQFFGSVELDN